MTIGGKISVTEAGVGKGSKDIVARFDSLSRLFKIRYSVDQLLHLRHLQGRDAGQGSWFIRAHSSVG